MNASHVRSGGPEPVALVDTHVHIHDCFDLATFLSRAARNFAAAAADAAVESDYAAVMCLTETSRADVFGRLAAMAGTDRMPGDHGWTIGATSEPESVTACHPELGRLHLVAGKQIVVAERLEVLALGCMRPWPDGLPAADVIDELTSQRGIAVLPWGFGKWLGNRGQIVRDLIEAHRSEYLFLGDNSGRPILFAEPSEFELGRRLGMRVLPGTDPLPFASESGRAGSFGCIVEAPVGNATPWSDVRRHIVTPATAIRRYGRLESPFRFVRNQVAMQYVVRTAGVAG
jgi:hypothetical protein